MSNVSSQHSVVPFVSGETKPLTGQRLAKVGYKKTKECPNPPKSIAVSLPQLSDDELLQSAPKLLAVLRESCESIQDKIIRSLYESREYNLDRVSDAEIGIDSIAAYASSEQSGGRITKEYLEQWFDANMRDNLTVVIADKLGFEELNPEQLDVVNEHLAGCRGLIASITGNKTMLTMQQIVGIRRAIDVSAVGDSKVVNVLLERMNTMEQAHNAQLTAW